MRPSEALKRHRDEVLEIISRYPVKNPRVFGSVARGEDEEGSDLDILVEHDGRLSTFELAGLELDLERVLDVRVDVQTPAGLAADVEARVAGDARPLV
jgi:uncharacterized protein